ncbi:MAG: insulinase family protein [Actinobacteria bacterium]|nr:insulinase family protein [Actinomycetota bacterium]
MGFWVPTGSRNEKKSNNGITHLIEHLIFKGTEKRTYRDIAIEFDMMGAEFNAYTDKENCCIYADFIDEHLGKSIELLFDIICNPLFLTEHIKTEKKVVLEEIKMVEDNPSDSILNYFYNEVFDGHPLSLPVLGTRKILAKINKRIIKSYFSQRFGLGNMVISAAGNIKHEDLIDLIKENTKTSIIINNNMTDGENSLPQNCKGLQKIHNSKTKAVHLCFGGLGCSRSDGDKYPLSLFTNLLGGTMSSRLFQKVREDEGLSYNIFANNVQYKDTGLVFIYSASSNRNVNKILRLVKNEIDDIRKNRASIEELERARENIKGNIVLGFEEISSRMFRLGKSLMFDKKVLTINQILKKIDKVNIMDISRVAEKYFDPENFSTVILGKNSGGKL